MNRKQPYVSDYLLGVGARLKKELGSAISGFYLHGSLVNDGGAGFAERRSDVDLLFSTPASHAQERTALASKLQPIAIEIENGLRALLPNREFLPVASFCFATDFELAEGIHKNRNTRRAFSTEAFRSLLSTEESPIPIGETLKDDLVGLHFPAWTVLAEAQRFRTKYISVRSDLNATIPDIFDDPALPLPKELLRSTYLYSCLDDRRDPAIETEDDIAKGYDVIKDILDSTGKIDSMALDLFRIIRTNRPGGKGDRRPLSSYQILYMWEVLSIQTQLMLIERRRDSQKAALRFAADPVNQELSRLGATDLEAVDMAIQLYRGEDLVQNGFIPVEIRPHLEMSLYEFKSFSETNLDRLALEWPTSIQEYLRSRHGGDGSSDSQCKVGFSGLSYSQTGIDRPVKLAVRPLAYWVTQQFNKEIAAHPENAQLQRLRDEFAKTLFRSAEDFNCSCPSSLYLELAIITSDEYIPQLLKRTKHSVFGKRKGDPVATCGVELGFSWKNHIDESSGRPMLNIEKAVYESLQSELQIAVEDVAGWSIGSLAIQHAHLNTAILGVVRLRLTRGELLDRLNRPNKYFHDSPVFLSRKEAILSIQADRGTGKWHQTALMRLQLID